MGFKRGKLVKNTTANSNYQHPGVQWDQPALREGTALPRDADIQAQVIPGARKAPANES